MNPLGEPLPGANVAAHGETTESCRVDTASDHDGRYCLNDLPAGTYEVEAVLDGFTRECHHLTLDEGGAVEIDLVLRPALQETIVVTGTRTDKRLKDAPVRTELITRDFIDTVGARTMADAVEYMTGVRVESNCQNCNYSHVRLLGLEGPYTQILLDGQPMLSSLAHVYGIEHIPARFISRIEIVKGGGSALYGPRSVGGVINVVPREPSRSGGVLGTRLSAMGGEPHLTVDGALDWVPGGRRTTAMLYGQMDLVRPLDLTADGFTEVSRRHLGAGGLRIGRMALGGRGKLVLDLNVCRENRRGGDRLDLPPHETLITEAVESARYSGGVSWFHQASPGLDYRLGVSYAGTRRDSYYGAGMDPDAYGSSTNDLVVADSQVNHYLGRHILSWGGQLTSDAIRDEQPAYDRLIDATYVNLGGFVQEDWSFARRGSLVLGVRVDKHSAIRRAIVSPRVAIKASPAETVDVRASIARGFRAPEVFDEDLHILAAAGEAHLVRHAENLREESSWSCAVGADWTPQVGPGETRLEVNAFHTRLADLFRNIDGDDPSTPERELLKVNLGGARVYGVELNVDWTLGSGWSAHAGLVAQRSLLDDPEPDFGSRSFFRTPEVYGQLAVTYRRPDLADIFVGARWTGPMDVPHYAGYVAEDRLETSPTFWVVDASLSRRFRLGGRRFLVLSLVGKNLTDAYQSDLDQGPDRDSGYVYGPRFPRSAQLAARIEF